MKRPTAKNTGIHTSILRSGRNNSSVLMDGKTLILIDCGIGPRILEKKLNEIDRTTRDITGALITHSHLDHMNLATVRKLTKEGVPLYSGHGVKKKAIEKMEREHRQAVKEHIRPFHHNEEFQIGSFIVTAFEVAHDSEGGCSGFEFKKADHSGHRKIVYATDLGYPSLEIKSKFLDCDILFIESDHDEDMLDKCADIPEYIKEDHIRGYHISNTQCCEILEEVLNKSRKVPEKIHLLHISDTINKGEIALGECQDMLKRNNFKNIEICL